MPGPESDVDPDRRPDLATLRRTAGAFSRPLQRVVLALFAGPATVAGLVGVTGVPRRMVEEVLEALAGDLVREGPPRGERSTYTLPPHLRPGYDAALDLPALAPRMLDDVVGTRMVADPVAAAAREYLAGLAGLRPRPDRDLDHVAADVDTLVRRALWLDASYDLAHPGDAAVGLLCVGDHDLTSLAVAACVPGVRVAVADVDDRILEFVDRQARAHGWDVTCHWGDFRAGLPGGLHGRAAVAFTDPPYTPEGVQTFLLAALAGLADHERGRVLLAYGYAEHQPALGLKVQQAVLDVHLAVEALLPAFHAYAGAQAIGSRSDLYVLQPTARTWRALPALAERSVRMYTHGSSSLESGGAEVENVLGAVAARVPAGGRVLAVGERWPRTDGAQRTSPATLLAQGLPRQLGTGDDVTVLVDLLDLPAGWLPRVLLAADAGRVLAVVPGGPDGPAGLEPLRDRWSWSVRHLRDGGPVLVDAVRRADPASPVAAALLSRAHGRLVNVWREALVADARRHGTTLTKNEARARVAALTDGLPGAGDVRLVEAPLHLLADVVERARGV